MPRKPYQCCSESFYHLTARTNNRDWFSLPMPIVWRIMSDYLFFAHHAFGVRVLSFVLMDNHFHLIAKFPRGNLSAAMLYFMRETSRSIAKATDRTNHVYGQRYFRSRIGSSRYLDHVYKYVYRNPVEAGLADRVEDYRFTTLRGLIGLEHVAIPMHQDFYFFGMEPGRTSRWLNRAPDEINRIAIKRALRKNVFEIRNKPNRPHPLERFEY